MKSRRRARETALQIMYQCDALDAWGVPEINDCIAGFPELIAGADPGEIDHLEDSWDDSFVGTLVHGTIQRLNLIDSRISASCSRWSIARMARVDRNILRIAAFELMFLPDVPVNVSINEGIEVAKRFGSEDSPMFINGVLDNLANQIGSGAIPLINEESFEKFAGRAPRKVVVNE